MTCNCITYNEDIRALEIGRCMYNCYEQQNINYFNFHQTCPNGMRYYVEGSTETERSVECKDGFYTPAYSYDLTCIKCNSNASNWLKFVLIAFLPLTIFYFAVVIFKINVHSTYLQGYVLYSQSVTTILLARNLVMISKQGSLWLKYIIYSMGTFYSIWNLDFFRFFSSDICLQTGSLATISLELVVAMYPVLLILITYGLILMYDRKVYVIVAAWKPFKPSLASLKRIGTLKVHL